MAQVPPLSSPSRSPDPRSRYRIEKVPTTKPRTVVSIYGTRVVPIDVEINAGTLGVGDTATVTLPIHGGPEWSTYLKKPTGDGAVVVEVFIGHPHDPRPGSADIAQMQSVFLGIVEDYTYDSDNDQVTFECSSLATLLTVKKQTTLTQNQNSQQYLEAVASAVGLKTSFRLRAGKQPSTLAKVFYRDAVVGMHNVSQWQILQACTQVDDADLWVKRDTVYYWARDTQTRPHYRFEYGSDLVKMTGKHAPQFSKNIEIEGRLDQPKTRTTHISKIATDGTSYKRTRVTTTVPKFGTAGSYSFSQGSDGTIHVTDSALSGGPFKTGKTTIPSILSKKQHIVLVGYNITPDEMDQLVLTLWMQLSRLEYIVTMSGDVTPELLKVLDVGTVFELYGCPWQMFNTGSQLPGDGSAPGPKNPAYFHQRLTIRFSQDDGLTFTSELVNHRVYEDSTL